ncbi:MAG: hypothetical protein JKY93_00790 [Gammaproteobacteria bacterium]|nr:hypothetical protein [Gammaproteobacteria bacterium]
MSTVLMLPVDRSSRTETEVFERWSEFHCETLRLCGGRIGGLSAPSSDAI